jgi:hypothetical protein
VDSAWIVGVRLHKFTNHYIEEVTEIEMDEIKGDTKLKGYQILEAIH